MNKENPSYIVQLNNEEDREYDKKISLALRELEKSKDTIKLATTILQNCKASKAGYTGNLVVEDYFDYSEEWADFEEKSKDSNLVIKCQREVKEKMLLQMTEMIENVLIYVNSLISDYKFVLGTKEIKQGTVGKHFKYAFKFTIDAEKVV